MANYCPTCQVKYTARIHYCLEKKVCRECGQEKAISEFPVHQSSFDGHKHSCIICFEAKKPSFSQREDVHAKKQFDVVHQTENRIQIRQYKHRQPQERKRENVLFDAYGYRWRKVQVEVDGSDIVEQKQWSLIAPDGARVSRQEALQEIARLQVHTPGHPATLWAKEMLARHNVVILDTETTGFGSDDEIIEIAIIDSAGRKNLDTLVQCQRSTIPKSVKVIHHIDKSMLKNAPTWPQIWDRLIRFLETQEIIIYNEAFDMRLLRQTARRYHLDLPPLRTHCLMKQYSSYVGQPSSHQEGYRFLSLAAACTHFQIEQPLAHRALADTQSALAVLHALAGRASVAGCNHPDETTQFSLKQTHSREDESIPSVEEESQRKRHAVTIERLDHLVLTVQNIEATCQFYSQVMGMQVVTFAQGRRALHFRNQKINLHEAGKEFEPKASRPTPGSADLCFLTQTPISLVREHLRTLGVEIILGPVSREGATGPLTSIYLHDPDNNLIEIAHPLDSSTI